MPSNVQTASRCRPCSTFPCHLSLPSAPLPSYTPRDIPTTFRYQPPMPHPSTTTGITSKSRRRTARAQESPVPRPPPPLTRPSNLRAFPWGWSLATAMPARPRFRGTSRWCRPMVSLASARRRLQRFAPLLLGGSTQGLTGATTSTSTEYSGARALGE